jgi:lipopolysaccharide/colanic/teichoic acid biosynthesis glycosyltransferase
MHLRRISLKKGFQQLWNVIRADMSVVGPMRFAKAEDALFWKSMPDYWTRHAMLGLRNDHAQRTLKAAWWRILNTSGIGLG